MRQSDVLLRLCILSGLLLPVGSSGCASASRAESMMPDKLEVLNRHACSMKIAVLGGRETNPMWTSQISNDAFRKAVESSAQKCQVFTVAPEKAKPDYQLDVALLNVDQPMMGFDLTVSVLARWTLVKASSNRVVWRKDIATSHTAGVGDAFVAVTRLRLANEGAARENIRQGLQEVSRLADLGGG